MQKIIFLTGIVAVLGIGTATIHADPRANPAEAIAFAKMAQKRADAVKGGWVTTDKLIAKAEKALAAGKKEEAVRLAHRAIHEAKLALAQAGHEAKHWSPPPYLR